MPSQCLHEQVAIVTGASGGSGRAISLAYAAEGAHVLTAVFLASEDASSITGHALLVDGGFVAQ
ncbi:hypothetical protein B0A49_02319 [Cryomyces minteri]|uniref:Uncharacterized protein n=1 Tax=Cryomyces minteri TaxID=331657 RepID=A0A4U0XFF1_9PEZI|nr:hypothetical protein B0A49_02319 [Cryomyces minteri]